jgi:Kdo2-lipid IVA lauroyltransferase/acyltransferase
MSAIGFYLQIIFLSLVALLPLRVLFFFADGLYIILYYVLRYRRNIVKDNLCHAFPGKSENERHIIEKGFYRHFADMIMESLKMIHMSPGQLGKRIPVTNPEILDKYRDSGKSIVAVGAHYGNWEWTLGIVQRLNYKTIGVYKPLNNARFDRYVNKMRSKFGTQLVSMREIIRIILKYNHQKIPTFNVFIADQSPVWEEVQYWVPFLNQQTAVYLGPEKIARQFDMVVIFGKVNKTARGRYSVELIPLEENPLKTSEFEITKKIFEVLEEQINSKPEYWLWSHRRWKLTRKRENEEKKGVFRFSENNTRI